MGITKKAPIKSSTQIANKFKRAVSLVYGILCLFVGSIFCWYICVLSQLERNRNVFEFFVYSLHFFALISTGCMTSIQFHLVAQKHCLFAFAFPPTRGKRCVVQQFCGGCFEEKAISWWRKRWQLQNIPFSFIELLLIIIERKKIPTLFAFFCDCARRKSIKMHWDIRKTKATKSYDSGCHRSTVFLFSLFLDVWKLWPSCEVLWVP